MRTTGLLHVALAVAVLTGCAPTKEECDPNPPFVGPILVDTAEQLEELRCMERYEGSVMIDVPGVEDLSALANLEYLGGDLFIQRSGAHNLDALGNLRSVETIEVVDNPELRDIRGLASLEHTRVLAVTGNRRLESVESLRGEVDGLIRLSIYGGDKVPSLEPLGEISGWGDPDSRVTLRLADLPEVSSLVGIEGLLADGSGQQLSLELVSLPKVENLEALAEVSDYRQLILDDLPLIDSLEPLAGATVSFSLRVRRMPLLTNLVGLEAVRDVEFLSISENDNLVSLEGLTGLESVHSFQVGWCRPTDFELVGNPKLSSLAGLEALRQVGGALWLGGNPQLTDVSALTGLEVLAEFVVLDNQSLDPAQLDDIQADLFEACGNEGEEPCGCAD